MKEKLPVSCAKVSVSSLGDLPTDRRPPAEAVSAFLDLAPLAAADPGFDDADFWPGLLAACQTGTRQTGLPLRANASLMLFDKAAFDAAGLPHPRPGWTWAEFQQAAQTLTGRQGEQTTRLGFLDSGRPLLLLAPFVDSLITRSGYDADRLAAELEWYVALAGQGAMPAWDEDTIAAAGNRDVLIGRLPAAMWVGSQSDLNRWQATFAGSSSSGSAQDGPGHALGVAPFPIVGGISASSNPISAGCAVISAGTSQSRAAWTWLQYLSTQPPAGAGLLPGAPARPSVAESSGYWQQMESATVAAIRYALEHGWYSRGAMPELAAVGEALNRALSGEATLAESLPATVEAGPVAPPPLPDSTPIAVATPQVTPTRRASSLSAEEVLVVDYYARGHPSQQAIVFLQGKKVQDTPTYLRRW